MICLSRYSQIEIRQICTVPHTINEEGSECCLLCSLLAGIYMVQVLVLRTISHGYLSLKELGSIFGLGGYEKVDMQYHLSYDPITECGILHSTSCPQLLCGWYGLDVTMYLRILYGGYCQSVELLEDELEEAGYFDLVKFQIAFSNVYFFCGKLLHLKIEFSFHIIKKLKFNTFQYQSLNIYLHIII